MRFSSLLSTPVIFPAGALKPRDFLGPLGTGSGHRSLLAAPRPCVAWLFAVVFLSRYFETRALLPFGIYPFVFGLASVVRCVGP